MFDSVAAARAKAAVTLASQRTPGVHAANAATPPRTLVVGAGPVGFRVAGELARAGLPVVLFNAERWRPYNRIKLTPFLSRDVQVGQVYQSEEALPVRNLDRYDGLRIKSIDPARHVVTDEMGREWPYEKLILAMGARPHVPPIPGMDLNGVYTFRDFDDAERLVARSLRSRRTVVIGGGLLGLEVARGMAARGVETIVLEHETRLLARQLDQAAGDLVAKRIERLGIKVRVATFVRGIEGSDRVERVALPGEEVLDCDTVVVCTGVRANMEIARAAGIAVGRGVTVDEHMLTSDPDIYAVGECAEYAGHTYGLVGPGLDQATACISHLLGGGEKRYGGSVPATRLKVVGIDVFSMGEIEQVDTNPNVTSAIWSNAEDESYRRIVIAKGRIVGGIAVGPWQEINRLQQLITSRARVTPWQVRRFRKTGSLFRTEEKTSVVSWSAAATVCNCTGVTRGALGDAIQSGCKTVDDLRRVTCASTVCGTCQPLLQELLGGEAKVEPVGGYKPLLVFSVIAALVGLLTMLAPAWPTSESVQMKLRVDLLWLDPLIKQISGFTLLGLMVVAAVIGLRKRIKLFGKLGGYNGWRLVHAGVGMTLVAILFAHTGFRLGDGLNFWLMAFFLCLSFLGGVAGLVTAVEHRLLNGSMKGARTAPRTMPLWLHILLFWPVPLLLSAHVLTVYFY